MNLFYLKKNSRKDQTQKLFVKAPLFKKKLKITHFYIITFRFLETFKQINDNFKIKLYNTEYKKRLFVSFLFYSILVFHLIFKQM